jgi:hypothetical protein
MTARFQPREEVAVTQVAGPSDVFASVTQVAGEAQQLVGQKIKQKQHNELLAERYMAEGDIAQTINSMYGKAIQSEDIHKASAVFNETSKAYLEKTIGGLNPAIQPLVRASAIRTMNSAQLKLQNRIFQQNQQDKNLQFQETYSQLLNQANNQAREGELQNGVQTLAQVQNMIKNAEQRGGISGERAAIYSMQAHRQFISNKVLGMYDFAKTAEQKKKFKEDFKKDREYDKFLDPDDKKVILNKMAAMDKEQMAALGFTAARQKRTVEELKQDALNTGKVDANQIAALNASGYKDMKLLKDDIQSNLFIHSKVQELSSGTLDKMKADKAFLDAEPYTNYKADKQRQKISQMLGDRIKQAESDPAQYTLNSEGFKNINENPALKGVQNTEQSMIQYQKNHGFTENQFSVLTKSDALNEVNEIHNLPLEEQSNEVMRRAMTREPRNRMYYLRDLQRNGLSSSTQYLLRIGQSDDKKVGAVLPDAQIAFSKLNDKDGGLKYYEPTIRAAGSTTNKLTQKVYDSNSFNRYKESLLGYDDANHSLNERANYQTILAAQLMSKGLKEKDAVEEAGKALDTGINYSSYNGWSFSYPENVVSSGRMHTAILYLEHQARQQSDNIYIPPRVYANLPPVFRQDKVPDLLFGTSKAVTSTDKQSVILTDDSGAPIRTKEGKIFSLRFDEIGDNEGEIARELDTFGRESKEEFMQQHKRYSSVKNVLTANYFDILGKPTPGTTTFKPQIGGR